MDNVFSVVFFFFILEIVIINIETRFRVRIRVNFIMCSIFYRYNDAFIK